MNLLATREILYTPPTLTPSQAEALERGDEELLADIVVDQYLFVFTQATVPGMGRYRFYMQDVATWSKETLEIDSKKLKGTDPEKLSLLGVAYIWARARATCKDVKKRTVPALMMDGDTAWESIGWPVEWEEVQSFVDAIPDTLIDAFAAVTEQLNPGLWSTRVDEKSKKVGSVNVR